MTQPAKAAQQPRIKILGYREESRGRIAGEFYVYEYPIQAQIDGP